MTHSILVVGPSWIGDMVLAQALFRTLEARRPGCAIDVLAPAWSLPLVARMPEVREGIPLEVGHGRLGLLMRYRVAQRLRPRAYVQAVVIPRAFKSALVPLLAGIPRRTGARGEFRFGLINDPRSIDHGRLPLDAQRFVALGLERAGDPMPEPLPNPALRIDGVHAHETMIRLRLETVPPVVVLAPGSRHPAKRWPPARYGELARALLGSGYQVWVVGAPDERLLCEQVVEHAAGARNLCGRTSLEELVDLLAQADVVVSNDSGVMHIAAAVGRPVVAIFGSSSPDRTPPLSSRARIVRLDLECSPCLAQTCPLDHTRCLTELPTAQVLEAVEASLHDARAQGKASADGPSTHH